MTNRGLIATLALVGLFRSPMAYGQDYALDAPERAHIRQTIEVGWTAPHETGGLLEIRAEHETPSRANYAYTHKNPQSILAPEAPGRRSAARAMST